MTLYIYTVETGSGERRYWTGSRWVLWHGLARRYETREDAEADIPRTSRMHPVVVCRTREVGP